MPEESFLLVSLKENKAKKLAQVINNDTSRLILDFLSKKKEATESEISKDLNLPISTVHYNIKQLVDNNLVLADEFHYSEKGKEVQHYKLANKLIIIAPQGDTAGFKEKLKSIWPLALVGIVASGAIHLWDTVVSKQSVIAAAEDTFMVAAPEMARGGGAPETVAMAAEPMVDAVIQHAPFAAEKAAAVPIAFWFLLGTVFVILIQVIIAWISARKNPKTQP